MKITRRHLKRIIREEKTRLLENLPGSGRHPDVEEGIWRGTYEGVWSWLNAEFDASQIGELWEKNPAYTESIADALEAIASEVRQGTRR